MSGRSGSAAIASALAILANVGSMSRVGAAEVDPASRSLIGSARSIGVVVLAPDGAEGSRSTYYAALRRVLEEETLLEVAPPDLFSASVREEAVRACAGDGACFASRLRDSGVSIDLLLTVSLAPLGDHTVIGLRLIDARQGRTGRWDLGSTGGEIDAARELSDVLRELLGSLIPQDVFGQVAALDARVRPPGAEVQAAGKSCIAPCRLERLPPGEIEVEVEKTGFVPWRGRVAAESRRTASLDLTLEPVPEAEPAWYASPWVWGGAALAVAAASASAVILLSSGSDEPDTVCFWNDPAACR